MVPTMYTKKFTLVAPLCHLNSPTKMFFIPEKIKWKMNSAVFCQILCCNVEHLTQPATKKESIPGTVINRFKLDLLMPAAVHET